MLLKEREDFYLPDCLDQSAPTYMSQFMQWLETKHIQNIL